MKYNEATKLIKELSKKYSTNNNDVFFKLIYKNKPVIWVDKQQQFSFGRINILDPELNALPYSHKLWMILAELSMTPISEREEHKWNIIVGNDSSECIGITCWIKSNSNFPYLLYPSNLFSLTYDNAIFTDEEFSDLIKYIKTLPNGEYQAKVAEHGKTEVKE